MSILESLPHTDIQQNWSLRKPCRESRSGLVSTHHVAASEIGAQVLREGGNAMDAAIAASFAITVLEPWMSGIGGGGYLTVYKAADRSVRTIHFGMTVNVNGWKSIGVPGHIAGIELAHQRFATKKWADLIEPSIKLAQKGLPITWHTTLRIATAMGELKKDPTAASLYLNSGVPPSPQAGQPVSYISLGKLADTLCAIAKDGAAAFYDGPLAKSMASDVAAAGGDLCLADLQDYQAEERAALSFNYRDKIIHTVDGPTAGPSLLKALQDLPALSGDPKGPKVEDVAAWAKSLNESYKERFEKLGDIDDQSDPACTTNLVTSDSEGNMVVLTQTLLSIFGAKVILPSSGILMNNGMMWFDPRPGRPNSIAPAKRPLSNMAPTLVGDQDGNDWIGIGASGGRRIFPCLLQLLSYLIDFDFALEDAFHAPRIDVCGADFAGVNPRFGPEVLEAVNKVLPARWQEHGVLPASFAIPSAIETSSQGENSVNSIGMADPYAPLGGVSAP
jgi:gamma-glutamyltranspeptidase/glutathione hydrolase